MARAPHPFRLPLDAGGSLTRQLRREWRAGPLHHLLIGRPSTDGLAIRPRDLRPADAAAGERLLAGEFSFGGERIEVGRGGDPWRRALPSRRFAVALHSFDWTRDLIAAGEAGQREALRLWLEWRAVFGRYNEFAWSGEALERRVFNLAACAAALAPLVSEAEGAAFVADLARQARHLLGDPGDPERAAERATAAALVGAALNGKAGETLRSQALPRLERLLPAAVLRDGVHASRSPERGLELLFDLLALDDGLSQLGAPAPVEVSRAVDRLSAATRFFTLADGRLAAFQGGEPGETSRIAAALALDAAEQPPPKSVPYGGYHRLEGRGLQIIADAGEIASPLGGGVACAQAGTLLVLCDGRRLITGSAWSASADADPALRGPFGGSCLALGFTNPAAAQTTAERQESPDAVWLESSHDGWRLLGFDCTRRLFLDTVAGELRGEDMLTPVGRPREPVRYAIRFHLAPDVAAQLSADGKSALLRPVGGHGWRLRGDSAAAELSPAIAFEAGEAKAAQVLTLFGLATSADGARVRWKLSRDEG